MIQISRHHHHHDQTFLSACLVFSFLFLSSLVFVLPAMAVPPKLFEEPVVQDEPATAQSGADTSLPSSAESLPDTPPSPGAASTDSAKIEANEPEEEANDESAVSENGAKEEDTMEENAKVLDETTEEDVAADTIQSAIFAGGCFWCMEPAFDKLEGVIEVLSGYTGGTTPDPTYAEVIGKSTGHFEAVRITYDAAKVSYSDLLKIYWENIDPTDSTGQFCDKGPQYLSAIFVANDEERKIAEQSIAEIQEKLIEKGKVVTQVLPRKKFYEAEEYHQKYYKRQAQRYKYYREACGRDKRLEEIWGPKF